MSEFTVSRKIVDDIEETGKASNRPWVSFEFFPPKTEQGVGSLKKCITHLMEYDPLFLDVTWGAGGSTSSLTFDLCKMAKDEFGANPNMHLTCTNMDVEHIHTALDKCRESGIRNILALRGDPPAGQERWTAADVSLSCAADLVKYIQEHYGDFFSIAVAGYPEGHPNAMTELPAEEVNSLTPTELARYCKDTKTEIVAEAVGDTPAQTVERPIIHVCRDDAFAKEMQYLKSKIDLGARFIVTQMFFDVEVYGTFVAACRAYGINVPVVPGIMCISNYGGFKRMIKFCKSRVQQEILDKMEELKDNAEAIKEYGIQLGVQMCKRLQELGAPGFHFYTLNTSHVTIAILEGLGYHRKEHGEIVQA